MLTRIVLPHINPFCAIALVPYPLEKITKTSEKTCFFENFRRYRKRLVAWNGLIQCFYLQLQEWTLGVFFFLNLKPLSGCRCTIRSKIYYLSNFQNICINNCVFPSLHTGSSAIFARHIGHVRSRSNHITIHSSQNICYERFETEIAMQNLLSGTASLSATGFEPTTTYFVNKHSTIYGQFD